jgi:hypothetical protein
MIAVGLSFLMALGGGVALAETGGQGSLVLDRSIVAELGPVGHHPISAPAGRMT